jgi:hypothetical protein
VDFPIFTAYSGFLRGLMVVCFSSLKQGKARQNKTTHPYYYIIPLVLASRRGLDRGLMVVIVFRRASSEKQTTIKKKGRNFLLENFRPFRNDVLLVSVH